MRGETLEFLAQTMEKECIEWPSSTLDEDEVGDDTT